MNLRRLLSQFIGALVILLGTLTVWAHCDTMNGPVVRAAQKALQSRNVNHVLIWVKPEHDAEVLRAFNKTLKVRTLGKDARELADMYFFETVVRVHRTGEGEPYTGIKPVDTKIDAGIEAADEAIRSGNAGPLLAKFAEPQRGEIAAGFQQVVKLKGFKVHDVAAGRAYVRSYVSFIHRVEHLLGGPEAD